MPISERINFVVMLVVFIGILLCATCTEEGEES